MRLVFASILLVYICLSPVSLHAQVQMLDVNNIGFGVNNGGVLANHEGYPFSSAPINGTNHIIWKICPLWSAYNDTGQLYGDIMYISSTDWHAGPHAETAQTLDEELVLYSYKTVRKINRWEIDDFKEHYGEQGYTVPESIRNWPGNGDSTLGMAAQLAPFTDHNANGIYEPDSGDYPLIKGDQAILQLLHDMPSGQLIDGGDTSHSMVDYRQMVYAYEAPPGSLLDNVVFIDMQIINQSDRTYHDFVYGYLTFYQLGFYGDNYLGTDTIHQLQYCYNGDTVDKAYGVEEFYGSNLPATGIQFLNQSMDASMSPTSELSETWLLRYQFYQRAYWPYDTIHLTDDEGNSTNFSYYDHPDDPTGWNEPNESNPYGERRAYSSTFFGDFHPGDTICHTVAVLFAEGSIPYNRTAALNDLIEMASLLHGQYPYLSDANDCLATRQELPYWETELEPVDGITFLPYPNPAGNEIWLNTGPFHDTTLELELRDMTSKVVAAQSYHLGNTNSILSFSLPQLATGMYLLVGKVDGTYFSRLCQIQR